MIGSAMIGTTAAALVATVFPFGTIGAAATGEGPPPPGRVVIELTTVNGSGCGLPPWASVAVAPDNMAFTISRGSATARVGVGAGPTDFRKNCQIGLNVHVPRGFTYAIAGADHSGLAHLEKGATGLFRTDYYFQGSSVTTSRSHPLVGPFDDAWQFVDGIDVADLVYAPCGEQRNLTVNTVLRVDAGTSDPATTTSSMTLGTPGDTIDSVYRLAWKQCPPDLSGD
ncbi:DUF4360 domain-containing protein [Streptomyces sp. NPDC002537]